MEIHDRRLFAGGDCRGPDDGSDGDGRGTFTVTVSRDGGDRG